MSFYEKVQYAKSSQKVVQNYMIYDFYSAHAIVKK